MVIHLIVIFLILFFLLFLFALKIMSEKASASVKAEIPASGVDSTLYFGSVETHFRKAVGETVPLDSLSIDTVEAKPENSYQKQKKNRPSSAIIKCKHQ